MDELTDGSQGWTMATDKTAPTFHDFIDIPEVGRQPDSRYAAYVLVKDCDTGQLSSSRLDGDIFDDATVIDKQTIWERRIEPVIMALRHHIVEMAMRDTNQAARAAQRGPDAK
jgi:hypothetical protein